MRPALLLRGPEEHIRRKATPRLSTPKRTTQIHLMYARPFPVASNRLPVRVFHGSLTTREPYELQPFSEHAGEEAVFAEDVAVGFDVIEADFRHVVPEGTRLIIFGAEFKEEVTARGQ